MTNVRDMLIFWSGVALVLRLAATAVLLCVARIQYLQFRVNGELQPLKRMLFWCVVAFVITNIPIILLHVQRIEGILTPTYLTVFATVTNAAGMLLVAVLLYSIYHFRTGGDDEE